MREHWLLLRGLARESGHWGSFIQQMQAAFPEQQIASLDLPGTGQFFQQTSPNQIETIVEINRQHALKAGLLGQPINLLAISLGGMVAWEWLQRYPNDIKRLVLINTSFANLSPFYHRLRWGGYLDLFALLTKTDLKARERAILQKVSNLNPERLEIMAKNWAELAKARPISAQTCFNQMLAASRYQAGNKAPLKPVLLINSLGDQLVSPACSQAIQQHYQLPLLSHPSAGHDLPLDDAQWLIAQLKTIKI